MQTSFIKKSLSTTKEKLITIAAKVKSIASSIWEKVDQKVLKHFKSKENLVKLSNSLKGFMERVGEKLNALKNKAKRESPSTY